MQKTDNVSALIYDGECPVCNNYVSFSNARKNLPGLMLLSARENHPLVELAWKQGINLNDEMVLYHKGEWHSGAQVILKMTTFGSLSFTERFLAFYIGRSKGQNFRYSILVWLRKLLLRMLGRKEIEPPRK